MQYMGTSALRALAGAIPVVMLTVALVGGAAAAELLPYRAIYSLKMEKGEPGGRFTDVTGSTVSSLDRTCDGWSISEEIAMRMQTAPGGEFRRDLAFTAEESKDGRRYRFKSRSMTNDIVEDYEGTAEIAAGAAGRAIFTVPEKREMPLAPGTVFYVGLTKWLVDLAESGARNGEVMTFDGTDADAPEKVTAFIIPEKSPPKNLPGDEKLLAAKAWHVRMAFFADAGAGSEPEYEIAARVLANGIVTGFQLIFKDFTVQQSLEDLLPAREPSCG